jgi:hypothetical protein
LRVAFWSWMIASTICNDDIEANAVNQAYLEQVDNREDDYDDGPEQRHTTIQKQR